jgi:putative spermidine/putrescine transport system permease protein
MAQLIATRSIGNSGQIARSRRVGKSSPIRIAILVIAVVYMLLPLIATVGFSLATVWSRTILPKGYTLHWYRMAIDDPRFSATSIRTIKVVIASSILSPALVTPALLYVHLRRPLLKPWLEFFSILPWALPGVVLALAMIRTYISPYNVNRPALLVLTYVLLSLPFMFRSIDAALSSINARTLVEAAQVLGAGWIPITLRILLPNIMTGILSGALLVSALAAGEYALASLMVGSGWKTFPIYQAQAQSADGRIASALAVMGIAFTFLISVTLIALSLRTRRGGSATATPMATK